MRYFCSDAAESRSTKAWASSKETHVTGIPATGGNGGAGRAAGDEATKRSNQRRSGSGGSGVGTGEPVMWMYSLASTGKMPTANDAGMSMRFCGVS